MDELHTPVFTAWKRLQDAGIEYKSAIHALKAAQRVVQGSVVVTAQIAPHPHQGTGRGHGLVFLVY
jgi:molybdenum-dependent DNA-binding transcriptional regulator ModE